MGFFDKIKAGLSKTRAAISEAMEDVFTASELDSDFYDDLEETLIMADLGRETAMKIVTALRQRVSSDRIKKADMAREALKEIIADMLKVGEFTLDLSTSPAVCF